MTTDGQDKGSELVVVARWETTPEHAATVRAALAEMRRFSLEEPGCRAYEVNQVEGAPHAFVMYERYDSVAANEAHRASDHFRRLVLERCVPLLVKREVTRCLRVL